MSQNLAFRLADRTVEEIDELRPRVALQINKDTATRADVVREALRLGIDALRATLPSGDAPSEAQAKARAALAEYRKTS